MVQERSRTTRANVLKAARELIVEHGHEQVSLKQICERSGVSNGSVFHHFGSKEGIVRELFREERGKYLHVIADAIIGHKGDPCDAFAAGTRAALTYQAKNPVRYERLIAEFIDGEWMRHNVDVWLEVASKEEAPVIQWAAEHFANGALPILPPAFFQASFLGPVDLLARAHRQGRLSGELDEYGEALGNVVSNGLKALRGNISEGAGTSD
ncbi:putative tetR-family transcriptional regulatory protein [Erythrobacter sp. SD-21]|nr:putative tetR-family transcriptional regulatory protein [Erythrobacter sp. SD-21]